MQRAEWERNFQARSGAQAQLIGYVVSWQLRKRQAITFFYFSRCEILWYKNKLQ
jgi:hypothetical protein